MLFSFSYVITEIVNALAMELPIRKLVCEAF